MSNEIATIKNEDGILATRPFGFKRGQFWCSINLTDPKDAIKLIKLRQGGVKKAKECVNLPFKLVHMLRRWGSQLDDDSGEVREYIGTSFMMENGEVISSGSIGIERDIESLFALELVPPYHPPIDITFELYKSSKGNDMIKCAFNEDDLAKRLARKGKK